MKRRRRWLLAPSFAAAAAVGGAPAIAFAGPQADEMPVAFGADQLRLDTRTQALQASGNVHVDQPPFHLLSEDLTLRRVPIGVELAGQGVLVFCPCLGAPLSLRFSGATVAPPHDVVLRNPVLQVFGVPVLWAPALWLRSAGRFGLLPPDVAWRGADGLFVGGGVHVPWRNGDWSRWIDLHAGGYVEGGAAIGVAVKTAVSQTQLRWDDWRGDTGVALVLSGATDMAESSGADRAAPRGSEGTEQPASGAWAVDALRGARAVKSTTDVDVAAFPFDQAEAASTWRSDGWTWSTGVVAVAPRGADLLDGSVAGPMVLAHRGDAIARAGSYDVGIEGGALGGAGLGTLSYARAEGGALLATQMGVVGASLAARAIGDVGDDGARNGAAGAAQVRVGGGVPLLRGYASGDEGDPWVHRTEPRLEAAVLATHAGGLGPSGEGIVPLGRGMTAPDGLSWVGATAWHNAFGRWGSRTAAEVDAYAGAVGAGHSAQPLLRARAAVGGEWLGLDADFARVGAAWNGPEAGAGGVLLGRVRFGAPSSWLLSVHVAGRDGVDPILARLLVDAPLEPASGFLVAPGWTGGARAGVPLGTRVTLRGGADVDFDARALVAALGALEVHDPCGCVVVRTSASHRIGRGGVDVWLTVDLPRL